MALNKTAEKILKTKDRAKALLAEKNRRLKEANLDLSRQLRDLGKRVKALETERKQLFDLLDKVRRSYPPGWSSTLLSKIRALFPPPEAAEQREHEGSL